MGTFSSLQSVTGLTGVSGRESWIGDSVNYPPLRTAAHELVQLNLQFLLLPIVESTLLDKTGQRFGALPNDARMAAADCLFSLFTIGFNDSGRWLPLLARAVAVPCATPTSVLYPSVESEFVASVIFFAWHMAHTDPAAARVLLELNGEVAAALRRVSISRLHVAVAGATHWLEPRWLQNRHFWPALARSSCAQADIGLRAVKLLGRQLLATESLTFPTAADERAGRTFHSVRARRRALAPASAAVSRIDVPVP